MFILIFSILVFTIENVFKYFIYFHLHFSSYLWRICPLFCSNYRYIWWLERKIFVYCIMLILYKMFIWIKWSCVLWSEGSCDLFWTGFQNSFASFLIDAGHSLVFDVPHTGQYDNGMVNWYKKLIHNYYWIASKTIKLYFYDTALYIFPDNVNIEIHDASIYN